MCADTCTHVCWTVVGDEHHAMSIMSAPTYLGNGHKHIGLARCHVLRCCTTQESVLHHGAAGLARPPRRRVQREARV